MAGPAGLPGARGRVPRATSPSFGRVPRSRRPRSDGSPHVLPLMPLGRHWRTRGTRRAGYTLASAPRRTAILRQCRAGDAQARVSGRTGRSFGDRGGPGHSSSARILGSDAVAGIDVGMLTGGGRGAPRSGIRCVCVEGMVVGPVRACPGRSGRHGPGIPGGSGIDRGLPLAWAWDNAGINLHSPGSRADVWEVRQWRCPGSSGPFRGGAGVWVRRSWPRPTHRVALRIS